MHRHSAFDLGYTHEMAPMPLLEPIAPAAPTGRASDLTTRLLCLKALHDSERDHRRGSCGLSSRTKPRRRRVH